MQPQGHWEWFQEAELAAMLWRPSQGRDGVIVRFEGVSALAKVCADLAVGTSESDVSPFEGPDLLSPQPCTRWGPPGLGLPGLGPPG